MASYSLLFYTPNLSTKDAVFPLSGRKVQFEAYPPAPEGRECERQQKHTICLKSLDLSWPRLPNPR